MKTAMKEILERLEKAIAKGNAADDAWSKEPLNESLEAEFIAAYREEYEIRIELASAITHTLHEINYSTALKMTYNPKLADLIKNMA